jgi:hypothetical protein
MTLKKEIAWLLILICIGCSSRTINEKTKRKLPSTNGFTEVFYDSLANIEAIIEYNNDSVPHGLARYFYSDGTIKKTAFYKNNRIYGPENTFSKEGRLVRELFIVNEEPKIAKVHFGVKSPEMTGMYQYNLVNGTVVDSNVKSGVIYYDKHFKVVKEKTTYFVSSFPDTLTQGEEGKLTVTVYPYSDQSRKMLRLGEFGDNYSEKSKHVRSIDLVDSTIYYSSGWQDEIFFEVVLAYDRLGWNHVTGWVTETMNEINGSDTSQLTLNFLLCESVYVKPR